MTKYKIVAHIASVGFLLLVMISTVQALNQTVGSWSFNEGTGTFANDTSGFNNNGTITGATWTTDAVDGSALNYDGNDYVSIIPSVNFSDFSISSWVKYNNTANPGTIFSTGNSSNLNSFRSLYKYNDRILYLTRNDESYYSLSSVYLQDDTYYYISVIQDGSTVKLYINNIYQDSAGIAGLEIFNQNHMAIGALWRQEIETPFSGIIDQVKLYNYVLNPSERTLDYQQFQPVLAYPTGGMTINATYPPMTMPVNFSWHDTEYPSDRIIIAKDSGFNILSADVTTSNDYYSVTLEPGTYYWKVTQYNSSTGLYGDTKTTSFILHAASSTQTGTAIQGTVYETINNQNTPVSGALVILGNNISTQTQTMVTGSNGYFVFPSLNNASTYYMKASRSDIYKDSNIEYVTTGIGTWTTKNLLLQRCTSDYDCGNNQHYVSFYVQDVHYMPYQDVGVSISNYGETSVLYSGTTGNDGIYQVRLIKNQKYTITFTHGSDTVTWNNYFPSDSYTVTLGTLPLDFSYNITGDNTRFLVRWSNLVGSADMAIRNTTGKVLRQTNSSTSGSGQFSFTLQNLTDIYYLSFNASTTSGNVNTSRVYDYRGSSAHPIGRDWSYGTFTVSQAYKNYVSYIFIIILSGSFGALFAPLGGVILILSTLFFVWYGWLQVAGISTAFVGGIAVIVIARYLQTKDGE